MCTLSIILFFKTTLVARRQHLRGVSPHVFALFFWFRCEIKSIIDKVHIIGSDGSRAGVEEETALVCRQRRRTGGATAVRRLDDDGGDDCVSCFVCYLVAKFLFI